MKDKKQEPDFYLDALITLVQNCENTGNKTSGRAKTTKTVSQFQDILNCHS